MRLPVALKNQLEESERRFEMLLDMLGMNRKELERLVEQAEKMKAAGYLPHSARKNLSRKGRKYHV